jgi:HEAT repeat protein
MARLVGGLMLATLVWAAATHAQVPTPQLPPDDPVEAFRQLLNTGRSFGTPTPEHLKRRKDTLETAAARIRTLGDLSRALLLLEWNKPGQEPAEEDVDRGVRDRLLDRFTQGVKQVIARGDTLNRIAVANLIGETASALRRQDIQVQESTRGLLDRTGKSAPMGGSSYLRGRMRALASDLAPLADDPSPGVRRANARALGNIEGDPNRTIPPLRRLLNDPDVAVRRSAAAALGDAVGAAVVQFQSGMMPPSTSEQPEERLPTEAEMWRGRAGSLLSTIRAVVPVASSRLDDPDVVVRRVSAQACRQASGALVNLVPNLPQDLPARGVALDELTLRRVRELQASVPLIMKEMNPSLDAFRRLAAQWTQAAADSDPQVRLDMRRVFEDLGEAARKLRRYQRSLEYPDATEPGKEKPKDGQSSAPPGPGGQAREPGPDCLRLVGAVQIGVPKPARNSDESATAVVHLEPAVRVCLADAEPSGPEPAGTGLAPPERSPPRTAPAARPASAAFEQKSEVLPPPAKAGRDVPSVLEYTVEAGRAALVRGLSDPMVRIRLASLDALEAMGDAAAPALPAIVRSLQDPNLFVRWAAARILGALALSPSVPHQPDLAVPALARLLRPREDLEVRIVAANSLAAYGPEAKEAVPALAAAVNQGDVEVRLAVLRALSRVGPEAAAAVPAIIEGLRDTSPQVRAESARVLGRFGPAARSALPALRRAMSDADDDVRRAASDAVLAIDLRR